MEPRARTSLQIRGVPLEGAESTTRPILGHPLQMKPGGVKWTARDRLAQPVKWNLFGCSYYESSWSALRYECLGVDHHRAHPISKFAERLVCRLEVSPLICDDEPDNVLCDKDGGPFALIGQFPKNANPLPEQARPCSCIDSAEIACKGEVLAWKRSPRQIRCREVAALYVPDITKMEFIPRVIRNVDCSFFCTVVVCPQRLKLRRETKSNKAAAGEEF